MINAKKLLCLLSALAMCMCWSIPAYGAAPADSMESGSECIAQLPNLANTEFQEHTSGDQVVELIKSHEGFLANKVHDGATGYYIGHGSRWEDAVALFGPDCEPITEEQAEELTRYQLEALDKELNNFLRANNIIVNQNQYDALSDFSYGLGLYQWTMYKNPDGTGCLLKEMLLDDPSTWTKERVEEAFGAWKYAGTVILPGLVTLRAQEAAMFLKPVENGGSGEDPDPPEPQSFTDVLPEHWYYNTVMTACELGLMKGNGDGTFTPGKPLTRAQLVVALANFAQADLSGYSSSDFTDVPSGTWYTSAVAWAAENGYVNGYEDDSFRPNTPVSREQLCCILARYLRSQNVTVSMPSVTFTDQDQISSYALRDVAYCSALGLIHGFEDGRFSPRSGATRAETAAILVRMHTAM